MKEYAVLSNIFRPHAGYRWLNLVLARDVEANGGSGEVFIMNASRLQADTIVPEQAIIRCAGESHIGYRPLYILNPDFEP